MLTITQAFQSKCVPPCSSGRSRNTEWLGGRMGPNTSFWCLYCYLLFGCRATAGWGLPTRLFCSIFSSQYLTLGIRLLGHTCTHQQPHRISFAPPPCLWSEPLPEGQHRGAPRASWWLSLIMWRVHPLSCDQSMRAWASWSRVVCRVRQSWKKWTGITSKCPTFRKLVVAELEMYYWEV